MPTAVAMAVVLAATTLTGCGLSTSQVICDMGPPPTDPRQASLTWANGSAIVIGSVGEPDGRTQVYDPGVRADRVRFTVEEVVATSLGGDPRNRTVATPANAALVDRVANVRTADQPASCGGKAEHASLEPGDRVMLVLLPPGPTTEEDWTVNGALAALDLSAGATGDVATWQHRGGGDGTCDGHLAYDLAALRAAFADPTAPMPDGSCVPDA